MLISSFMDFPPPLHLYTLFFTCTAPIPSHFDKHRTFCPRIDLRYTSSTPCCSSVAEEGRPVQLGPMCTASGAWYLGDLLVGSPAPSQHHLLYCVTSGLRPPFPRDTAVLASPVHAFRCRSLLAGGCAATLPRSDPCPFTQCNRDVHRGGASGTLTHGCPVCIDYMIYGAHTKHTLSLIGHSLFLAKVVDLL